MPKEGHLNRGSPREQPGLSGYSTPKSGVIAYFPPSWVPFAELARIDRPTGIYVFYLPHLFGTLYASAVTNNSTRLSDLVYRNVTLLAGTVFMRAAACAWNDNMDREYDRQVWRCRLRPLARQAVTPMQAHIFTFFLTIPALACLFSLPYTCWIIAVPSILLLALYPFAKRFTDFPQIVLGIQLAIGFFMGFASIDHDLLRSPRSLDGLENDRKDHALLAFYLANVCWTIVYDTVYAQQDVEDDAKAGVRSMAVRFRGSTRTLLCTTLAPVLRKGIVSVDRK
ncbi:hypothetical protein DL769_005368 [Monosporascus sp. CRB-8-3]|nr:hypothetical protein DL769_005368 [Monosporascus sp. CRB-8-3]